jgi:hypothetical protein
LRVDHGYRRAARGLGFSEFVLPDKIVTDTQDQEDRGGIKERQAADSPEWFGVDSTQILIETNLQFFP